MLNITAPGGFERFYRDVGEPVPDRSRLPARRQPPVDAITAAAARHGSTVTGPPP